MSENYLAITYTALVVLQIMRATKQERLNEFNNQKLSDFPTRKETSYSDRRFWVSYILFIITIGEILVLFTENKTSIKRNILTIKQNTSGSKSG